MLAVVRTPRTEIRITGFIPADIMELLRQNYGKQLKLTREEDREEYVDVFETKEYKEFKKNVKPGDYVRIYRQSQEFTQTDLGKKVGMTRAYICDIEKGRRPISKVMAKKMAELFGTSVSRFI
jgi:DNA-binding XRE family transcriptional regulator